MLIIRFLILMICISLLTACMTANTNKPTTSNIDTSSIQISPTEHAATEELLDFIAQYSGLPATQQEQVYKDNLKTLDTQQNRTNLLTKKAIMLSLPNSKVRNTTHALTLLNALLNNYDLNTSDANLIRLLLMYTQESSDLAFNLDNSTKMNTILKQKNKALEQKLNDLKNIEKTMIERNTKVQ